MAVKQELLKLVPRDMQKEPHFLALLDHIKKQNLESKEHLRSFLKQEIKLAERWLDENKYGGPAIVKSVRDKATHLDVLKKCYALTEEFLF